MQDKRTMISLSLLSLMACAPAEEHSDSRASSKSSLSQEARTYLEKAEQRLEQLERKLLEIRETVAERTTDASEELADLLEALERKHEDAVAQLAALGESAEPKLEAMGDRIDQSLDDFEAAVTEAWKRIGD